MSWTDDPRAAKRQRLDNNSSIGTRTQLYHAEICLNATQTYTQQTYAACSAFEGSKAIATGGCWDGAFDKATDEDGDISLIEASQTSLECCYGMLIDNPLKPATLDPRTNRAPARFESPNHVETINRDQVRFELLCPITCRIIEELEAFPGIETQLYCESRLDFFTAKHKRKPFTSWSLNIIIYGVHELVDVVGVFLSKKQRYLQDPAGCDRNVVYRNPHLSSLGSNEVVMTELFDSPLGNLEIERLEVGPDLLAQLMEDELPLPETEAPSIVTTPLFVHQKQGLTFMLRREQGWALDESHRDIWARQSDRVGRAVYRNNISGLCYNEAPEEFRGGLLADDMGLGKTLSILSLIAANQEGNGISSPPITPEPLSSIIFYTSIKTTLLIVPPPLIQSWEKQLRTHIRPHTLQWRTFHGQNQDGVSCLGKYDVVITTYHTLAAVWRKNAGHNHNENAETLFSFVWHRVILDEAHTIQNCQNRLSQACYAVQSPRRWAITGTPIQNKLTDFASIIRFLKVYPYSEQSRFDEDISKPWHQGNREGFLRLKTLVRAITISRTKAVVSLPPRIDEVHHLDFSPSERWRYDAAREETKALIEEATSLGILGSSAVNALQRLNILRLICCHGLLARSTQEKKASQEILRGSQSLRSQDSFYGELLGGSASCSQCGADLLDDLLEGSPFAGLQNLGNPNKCERTLCGDCSSQFGYRGLMGQERLDRLDVSDSSACASPSTMVEDEISPIDSMSTKIKALVADLLKHIEAEKSVVFSFWTYTLDLIELMLDDCGILYARIDGKMPLSKRNQELKKFEKNDSIRVILVSITCGGAGLDLTAASRAYLLEPHWNPMIEEQALCRVHRVGQRKPCTTIRYIMRGSFEEQVVELQKRKRTLAKVTFGKAPLEENGISLATLDYLKSALG